MPLMGATGSIGALATYVVASRYLDAGVSLAHIASVGLRPGMCALAEHPAGMRRAVRRYLGLAAAVGTAAAVLGWLAAGPLVTVPFGPRWPDAVGPVRVIALSALPILLIFVSLAVLVGSIAGTVVGMLVSLLLLRWHPNALSPLIGTFVGASVVAAIFVSGLRDLLAGAARYPAWHVVVTTAVGPPPSCPPHLAIRRRHDRNRREARKRKPHPPRRADRGRSRPRAAISGMCASGVYI
jgi:O-antigen/teichoic acid export membrane protein